MRRFDYPGGGLGRLWLEKFGVDANGQPSVRTGTVCDTVSGVAIMRDR